MHRRYRSILTASLLLPLAATPLFAQSPSPTVSVGAGVQTSFLSTMPDGGTTTNTFPLNSVRLYVSGTATDDVSYMLNTEYDSNNHINVLDAAAQFKLSPMFNIWAGRMLPPSDRANLYGPYYSNEWAVYSDGIQDGYPFVAGTGRDNGVLYWGQFGMAKISAGAFDGPSATGNKDIIGAARVQLDFWDPEGGYYLNGTYYGDKNLLAIGGAAQVQNGNSAYSGDFLLEKKIPGGGAFTIESEAAKYDKLGGYNSKYGSDAGAYGLVSYLFPPMMGQTGRFEVMGKYAVAKFTNGLTAADVDYTQKTTEANVDYVIKDFKTRIMLFFKNTSFDAVQTNFKQIGIGLQVQM
jgi:hypothetical protein